MPFPSLCIPHSTIISSPCSRAAARKENYQTNPIFPPGGSKTRITREAEAAPARLPTTARPARRNWPSRVEFFLDQHLGKELSWGHDFRDRLACATRFGAGWVVAPRDLAWEGQMR